MGFAAAGAVKIGATLPQLEIGNDPNAIAAFAGTVESLGYDHLVIWDHVLGAAPDRPGGWDGLYTHRSAFHEVFVTLAFLAAATTRIELGTSILVLPQRQTALVAKQSAELELLSRGRLRLGVGVGWNAVEFEALGESFHDRGRRMEEQIEILRRLWAEEVVDYKGRWHRITRAGINPRPRSTIPVWIGADREIAIRRAARVADGWFSHLRAGPDTAREIANFRTWVSEAGRDPNGVGVEATVSASRGGRADWAAEAEIFRESGVTHIGFHTMGAGFATVEQHLEALAVFRNATRSL